MADLVRAFLLAAALVAASSAAAQDRTEPADEPEIVVTGADMERQVRDFVDALTEAPPRGQLSRFEWEACPVAAGLSPGQRDAVVRRVRQVAEAAGIPLAAERCTPNVIVVVTQDKSAFIQELQRRRPFYFDGLSRGDIRRLARAPGHAAAWQIQGPPLNSDGVPLRMARMGEEMVYFNDTTRPPSRITPAARPHFAAAVVVVERGALDGLTTIQFADYAAMRAFARTDPDRLGASAAPTILRILDAPMGSAVPITLTRWDLTFLQGLYASPADLYAASQRSEIGRRMRDGLEQPDESADYPRPNKRGAGRPTPPIGQEAE